MPIINHTDDGPKYRERDCPLCGAETEVKDQFNRTPERHCTDCQWLVTISPTKRRSEMREKARIALLEDEMEELRERITELEQEREP